MKNNTSRHPIVYVYAIIASLIGVTAFFGEAFMAPVPQNLLALTWIPLLIALWGWVLNVKIGQQKFWKIAAYAVLIIDFVFQMVVPFITPTTDEAMVKDLPISFIGLMIALGAIYFTFVMSLYVIIFLYALTGWDKSAKKTTNKAKKSKPATKK